MALRALANGCGRRLNQTACRSSIYVSSAATGWTRPQWSASEHRSYSSGADNGSAEPDHAGSTTHFGFTTVDTSQKEGLVKDVFSRVASKYDLMNDVMSVGLHRVWKDEFVRKLGPFVTPDRPTRVLDVAGGTGDTAFRIRELACELLAPHDDVSITVCDINADMLAEGKQRYEALLQSEAGNGGLQSKPSVDFVEGDAQELPFADGSMDLYTITFGIRNVTHIDRALSEALRVLKPGGRFMCLEFSEVQYPVLDSVYDIYSFDVIPLLGQLVSGDRESYQYLVESIRKFPRQQDFARLIHEAGFQTVSFENMSGGIVAIHSGFKPLAHEAHA